MSEKATSHRLRIGIVTQGLEERCVDGEIRIANGGVGVYIYQLIRHLLDIDDINQYVLLRNGQGLLDIYRHPRVQCVFLPGSKFHRILGFLDLPYRRLIRELDLDLLHYPNQFGGAFLPHSARRIATLHDLTPMLFPRMHPAIRVLAYKLLARRSLSRCQRVIVPSRDTGRDLTTHGLAGPEAIVPIPEGINPVMRYGANSPGFSERYRIDRPFILSVGVLEPRKNHLALIEMFARIRDNPAKLELIIIGRPGWRWTNPLELPEYRTIAPFVRIFQDVSDLDLAEFYNRATAFVYPSFYEGFGLPLLEAMACGTPVIASSAPCLPEIAGDAALFADPYKPEEFASQLTKLLNDQELQERMVKAGFRRAAEFSWGRAAQATIEVYRSVCRPSSIPEKA